MGGSCSNPNSSYLGQLCLAFLHGGRADCIPFDKHFTVYKYAFDWSAKSLKQLILTRSFLDIKRLLEASFWSPGH